MIILEAMDMKTITTWKIMGLVQIEATKDRNTIKIITEEETASTEINQIIIGVEDARMLIHKSHTLINSFYLVSLIFPKLKKINSSSSSIIFLVTFQLYIIQVNLFSSVSYRLYSAYLRAILHMNVILSRWPCLH